MTLNEFEKRNAEYACSEQRREDDMASVPTASILKVVRLPVIERKSAAPYQQTGSSAVTWISRRGAGGIRLVCDSLNIGGQTITKAEYERRIRKIS